MVKDDAIVLVEATEIMQSLPSAMRHDDQIMDCVIESLRSGISKVEARQDALEIAQLKMGEAMAHGFNLVNNEIQTIKHSAELDRVHANYAQQKAEEAKRFAENALAKVQEVAISVVKAEAKADGARDLAKQSNRFQFDPVTGMAVCAIAIIGAFWLTAISTKSQTTPSGRNLDLLTCGVEVTCIPNQPRQPIPASNRGGV